MHVYALQHRVLTLMLPCGVHERRGGERKKSCIEKRIASPLLSSVFSRNEAFSKPLQLARPISGLFDPLHSACLQHIFIASRTLTCALFYIRVQEVWFRRPV